jgi:integrase
VGRPARGWWNTREGAYYAEIGGVQRRLEHLDGQPVARGDDAGRLEALARLVGSRPVAAPRTTGPAPAVPRSAGDLMTAWIAWHKGRGSRPRTIGEAVKVLAAFGRHRVKGTPIHRIPLEKVGLDHWSSYRRTLMARDLAPRTVEHHLDVVKACWRWGSRPVDGRVPARLLRHDPFRDLLVDLKPERRRVRGVLSPDQIRALLAAAQEIAPEAFRVALAIQADSGCRTSEVLNLRWEWWTGREFVIPPAEHKTGARTGRSRVVAVTERTSVAVDAWRASPLSSPTWVVVTSRVAGRAARPAGADWYSRWWRKVADRVPGLPSGATPYWLRDSFRARARAAGVDSKSIADSVGHSEAVGARHYSHSDVETARAAVERAGLGRGEG